MESVILEMVVKTMVVIIDLYVGNVDDDSRV